MSSEKSNQFPTPIESGIGWPWGNNHAWQPTIDGSKSEFPRITIVTPSLNQGRFIEKTIRSVLLQNYPNLEYIIIDGGSNDNSVDVIRYYSRFLTHWESKIDNGQSDAINTGMNLATGELLAWINSDDFYLPNALYNVGTFWRDSFGERWLSGVCEFINESGEHLFDWVPEPKPILAEALSMGAGVPQASSFWSRELWKQVNGLDNYLKYCMDEDLWMRFYLLGARPVKIKNHLATRVLQASSKTAMNLSKFSKDFASLILKYRKYVPSQDLPKWLTGARAMAELYGIRSGQRILKGDWKSATEFLFSGMSIRSSVALWGLSRALTSAIKNGLLGKAVRN